MTLLAYLDAAAAAAPVDPLSVAAQILSYGVVGLGCVLAILAYRLLSLEQDRVAGPNAEMLRSIYIYMGFSLLIAGIGFGSEMWGTKDRAAEIKRLSNELDAKAKEFASSMDAKSKEYADSLAVKTKEYNDLNDKLSKQNKVLTEMQSSVGALVDAKGILLATTDIAQAKAGLEQMDARIREALGLPKRTGQ